MKKIIRANSLTENYIEEKCFITEVLNRKDYPSFSLARARVEPGVTTNIHQLKDTDELYYILSGRGEVEMNGEIIGVVGEGDSVFIPQNQTQRIKNIGNENLIFLCVCSPRFDSANYQ